MFKFQDKELREELKRAGILIKDEVWEGSLTANRVVHRCDCLYDVVSALTEHLGLDLKQRKTKSNEFYFVKKKKGKAKDE